MYPTSALVTALGIHGIHRIHRKSSVDGSLPLGGRTDLNVVRRLPEATVAGASGRPWPLTLSHGDR
jgi:hypothetical protein